MGFRKCQGRKALAMNPRMSLLGEDAVLLVRSQEFQSLDKCLRVRAGERLVGRGQVS